MILVHLDLDVDDLIVELETDVETNPFGSLILWRKFWIGDHKFSNVVHRNVENRRDE